MRSTTVLPAVRPAAAAGLVLAVALTGACGSSSGSAKPAASSSPSGSSTSAASADPSDSASTSAAPTSASASASADRISAAPTSAADPGGSGPAVFAAAGKATRAAGSARVSIVTSTKQASGKAVTISETGSFDFRTSSGTLTVKAGGLPPIEGIFIGHTVYTKVPPSAAGGKPWAKSDSTGAGTSSSDPSVALADASGAVSDVRKVGTVTIDGVSTTEYTAAYDPIKALGAAASGPGAQVLREAGITSATLVAYIDPQGRYRRLTSRVSLKALPSVSGKAGPATVTATNDVTDYGVAVHVTAPPVSQVGKLAGTTS